ncbi:signal peptidase II [Candidatus Ruminimicrobium bovinum]|uniref:signal peptidase II n=1 Tax=Candidatus Ruminimicrobium bovinum TaxID=3242779 RepID=UPI0039B8669C
MKYYILVFIYVFLDQITKLLVIKNIPYNSFIKINEFFNLVNISNTGIAFSLFQGKNIFFIISTILIVCCLIFFIKKNKSILTKLQMHSLLLVISGGLGNLIDRFVRGYVVDFIDIGYKEVYRWPSFNIADSCVCIGVTLFVFSAFISKDNKLK